MRAVAIVRQSRAEDRDVTQSIESQAERIVAYCERESWELIADPYPERDVSGRRDLDRRPGLRAAVEAVEAGRAEVVVVAYFDRLFRSVLVQQEVVARVEEAGGRLLAIDTGAVSHATAAQWLQATMGAAVAEYVSRMNVERVADAQRKAVEQGRPAGRVPWGYLPHEPHRRATPNPERAPLVRRVFEMAADGASVNERREFLRAHGHDLTYSAVQGMTRNRFYLGELHFGRFHNPDAHEAIVDESLFRRANRAPRASGRRPPSDRLLARLGVLRCSSCDSRMVVARGGVAPRRSYEPGFGLHVHRGREPLATYRCPPNNDCDRHVSIAAYVAEAAVVEAVLAALRGVQARAGRASDGAGARTLEAAQARLDRARRVAELADDEVEAAARIRELRDERDAARARLDEERGAGELALAGPQAFVDAGRETRRRVIAEVVEAAYVEPSRPGGRPEERVKVKLRPAFDVQGVLDGVAATVADALRQPPGDDVAADLRITSCTRRALGG